MTFKLLERPAEGSFYKSPIIIVRSFFFPTCLSSFVNWWFPVHRSSSSARHLFHTTTNCYFWGQHTCITMSRLVNYGRKTFFNRHFLLFSFGGPQLYNLPFTYGQYVFMELADKIYNSVTVCFCALRKYVFHIGLKQEPNMD